MPALVALLRAVNVGGTSTLPMQHLKTICEKLGLSNVRTYIASGNIVFQSRMSQTKVKTALEAALQEHAGKPVGVLVRTAAEIEQVLAENPFMDAPPARTVAIFLDAAPPANTLDGVTGRTDEEIRLGRREIYVHYPSGIGRSKLKIRAAVLGTARNMNTISKLAEMARTLN